MASELAERAYSLAVAYEAGDWDVIGHFGSKISEMLKDPVFNIDECCILNIKINLGDVIDTHLCPIESGNYDEKKLAKVIEDLTRDYYPEDNEDFKIEVKWSFSDNLLVEVFEGGYTASVNIAETIAVGISNVIKGMMKIQDCMKVLNR